MRATTKIMLVACLITGLARADGPGSGGGGASSCSGDLNSGCSQVVGWTNVVHKTATDASDYLAWNLDQASKPMTQSISAQGSNGNLDTDGFAAFQFGRLALFSTGLLSDTTVRAGIYASLSTSLNPANPITLSVFIQPREAFTGAVLLKSYRPVGTWTSPFRSMYLGISDAAGHVVMSVTIAATEQACTSIGGDHITTGSWHHIGGTYDGSNTKVYLDGSLVKTCAQAGAIDYGTSGPWILGVHPGDSTTVAAAQFDEPRVATVARAQSYFQTVWNAMSPSGGN